MPYIKTMFGSAPQYEKKTEKIRFKFKSKVTGPGISFSMKADQINPHVMQNLD